MTHEPQPQSPFLSDVLNSAVDLFIKPQDIGVDEKHKDAPTEKYGHLFRIGSLGKGVLIDTWCRLPKSELVSELVDTLSPVNHKGLYQG